MIGMSRSAVQPNGTTGQPVWARFVRVRRIGYVRARTLARAAILIYVILTAVVTILTTDLLTVVFLVVVALLALRVTSVDRYVSPTRMVDMYSKEGLFIAEHVETGRTRHGETPSDALANLEDVIGRASGDAM